MFESALVHDYQSILLVLTTVLVAGYAYVQSSFGSNLPPSPVWPVPVLGHLPYLGGDIREKMLEFSKHAGPVFSLYMGTTRVVFLSSYTAIKEALVKQSGAFSARPHHGLTAVLGDVKGIGSSSGPRWKENRAVALSVLKRLGMGKNVMVQRILAEVKIYLKELAALQGEATDVNNLTTRATSNITCNMMIGRRFDYDDASFVKFLDCFDNIVQQLSGGHLHHWYPKVKYLPGDIFQAKALIKADQRLLEEIRSFIDEYESKEDMEESDNMVALYLRELKRKQKSGEATTLSRPDLERSMSDLLLGGSSTTSTSLLWMYVFLTRNPEVQEKMYEEIVRVVGTARPVETQDNLTYVHAVVLESQRLASIAPIGLPHMCTEDTTLLGYMIPKDTILMPHQDAVLLSEDIWGDPRNFRPERFLDEEGKLVRPEEWIVYSIGKRACPGEAMAKAMMVLFAASIIQRFKILPEDANCPPSMAYTLGLALHPKSFKIRFAERDNEPII